MTTLPATVHGLTAAEAHLLQACARTQIDAVSAERIGVALRDGVRWDTVLAAAEFHGIVPLLYHALGAADRTLVPSRALERVRIATKANVHHALFLTAELLRLVKLFESAGVVAVPFKGPLLSAVAYGDVTLRQFSDLDIFVRRADLLAATRLLLQAGYASTGHDGGAATARALAKDAASGLSGPMTYTFFRPDGRCRVDLQWRIATRFFAFALDGAAAWELSSERLSGRAVRTFSATDTLFILCVHGSKHRWERLKWVCDVAELLRARGEQIDWAALERRAEGLRAVRMVRFGLRLAQDVLGVPLPAAASRRIRADRAVATLVREWQTRECRPAPAPSGLAFHLRTQDDWGERTRWCATYVRERVARVVMPTARDRAWVTLPPWLDPLYFVLRPVRAAALYARAARRRARPHADHPTGGTPTC